MRRDLHRLCDRCPLRTHLTECPSCKRATVRAFASSGRSNPSRWLHVVGLAGMLAELVALVLFAVLGIWSVGPNMPVLLAFAGGLLAVLVSLLLWAMAVYLGSGVVEGFRGTRAAVAFGPTASRRNPVDRVFDFVERWAKRAHETCVGTGYLFTALFVGIGFAVAVAIDVITRFEGTDIRIDIFGTSLILAGAVLALPAMVRMSVGLLRPDPLPGDASRTAQAAIDAARRDRTEVEGVASAAGALMRSPLGDEVLAFRIRGTIGGHEVDDGDAMPFHLTDDSGRIGRVDADGPVLVALEARGERHTAAELAPGFLWERGLRGRGSVVIHRLRPGDRVRVSADFERGGSARSGYRDAVAMTLSAGDEPLLIQDAG